MKQAIKTAKSHVTAKQCNSCSNIF